MTTKVTAATAVGKKTAPRKTAASKTVAVAVAAETVEEKSAAPAKKKTPRKTVLTPALHPDQRHQLIQLAAYYIAERRGFTGASSDEDWIQAEQEVDAMIAAGQLTA